MGEDLSNTGRSGYNNVFPKADECSLRDSEKLKAEVHNSLNDLVETINESIAIVKGEKVPWEMERLDSDSDSDSGSSDTASDPEYDTELKQLLNSIRSCTTGLFRLSYVFLCCY